MELSKKERLKLEMFYVVGERMNNALMYLVNGVDEDVKTFIELGLTKDEATKILKNVEEAIVNSVEVANSSDKNTNLNNVARESKEASHELKTNNEKSIVQER